MSCGWYNDSAPGGSVDLSNVTTDYLQFNTRATPITLTPGQFQWNIDENTLDLAMQNGTAPTNNHWCTMLQLHVECDTIGSRNYQTK